MCNHCHEHGHDHSHDHDHHHPEIVQIMPVQTPLFAVYKGDVNFKYAVDKSLNGLSLIPVLFLGLIKLGEKSMVEGFFASDAIRSCEEVEGFKGYASSMEDAEKFI
ncbi:conserved hypothetical protein [Desulfamplus magnetovallimortis]|uniref:Uncharacterized protein n=1 Tax=Desulfamplus magnetovallimortis TaxID=1246637 RepID=A0A1W1HIN1_9BACT|nr:hypothetical protein [Desulfamplus magnetovallimortis]SLM32334.1 conserved hypothetical protein [Desulfamplus magnetovallimortis]